MNRHISRSKLASAAICFAFLAVVGVVYSAPSPDSVCMSIDSTLEGVDNMLNNCADFGDCDALEVIRNELECLSDACWNLDGGYCEAS